MDPRNHCKFAHSAYSKSRHWLHVCHFIISFEEMLNGSSEYNPPDFVIEAHKKALENVTTNQYAPITVGYMVLND